MYDGALGVVGRKASNLPSMIAPFITIIIPGD